MNRRWPIVIVMILSLFTAGIARHWAASERSHGSESSQSTAATQLSRMDSYALALLLGGLRGPLVMLLWPSSETQKQTGDLEDFDTKIEWIRLLQAEFDTVHLFQIWNKAYNISAQMANLGNKYRVILDALDYARSVDSEKPNDINILAAIGQMIYFDKFGTSSERIYYRERVREESRARIDMVRVTMPLAREPQLLELTAQEGVPPRLLHLAKNSAGDVTSLITQPLADLIRPKFSGDGISFTPRPPQPARRSDVRRSELDPVLDTSGNLLAEYLRPHNKRPANLSADSDWDDGSELQYLKGFEPFPYGISPFGFSYNYYKRAEVLLTVNGQHHAQLSDSVIDSRPAIALRNWSMESAELGRRRELEGFKRPIPVEKMDAEAATADLPLNAKPAYAKSIDEAIYCYAQAAALVAPALAEYERHLKLYQINVSVYLSHMDDLRSSQALAMADRDYLLAVTQPARRAELLKSAADEYRNAITLNELIVLQYYVHDEYAAVNYPKGVTRAMIAKANLPIQQIDSLFNTAINVSYNNTPFYKTDLSVGEYVDYVNHAQTRLKLAQSALQPASQPG